MSKWAQIMKGVVKTSNLRSSNMPTMPRLKGKATKIAWAILGEPTALKQPQKTPKQRRDDKRMQVEETSRVR